MITDGSGKVLSSNEGKGVGLEYDSFGVAMFTSGTAQTPYRPAGVVLDEGKGVGLEEGLDFSGPPVACPLYANRALALSEGQCRKKYPLPGYFQCVNQCYTVELPSTRLVASGYLPSYRLPVLNTGNRRNKHCMYSV